MLSCKFAEKEKYAIPENYLGNIVIMSNVKTGQAKRYADRSRLYVIRSTGILLTQFRETYGVINKEFYYVGKNETIKIKIPPFQYQDDKINLDSHKIYALFGRDMTVSFPNVKDTVGVQIITICKPKDYEY